MKEIPLVFPKLSRVEIDQMTNFLGRTDFNVGSDISVTIKSGSGNIYSAEQLGHLIDIDVDRDVQMVSERPCSNGGAVLSMGIPRGYKIELTFARMNNALERELMAAEQNWYTNKIDTKLSFQFHISNRDGSVDSYLAQDFSIGGGKLWGGKADKGIDQKLFAQGSQIVPS